MRRLRAGFFPRPFEKRAAKPAALCGSSQASCREFGAAATAIVACAAMMAKPSTKRCNLHAMRTAFAALAALAIASLLMAACAGAKPQPHGPPPEYEEPPVPVFDAGAALDAGTG